MAASADLQVNMKQEPARMVEIPTVKEELKRQIGLAVPMILINLLQFSVQTMSVMFVGHISELALSSSSLATSITNVTGFSLLNGMASALDTLCGQAYGAKQYRLLGLYLQRALIVLYASSIPLAIAWANMDYILLALGQDASISKQAGEYTVWLIPTLFAYATTQPLLRFMQAQSLVLPAVICFAFTLCCHIPICYVMVYKTGLESRGAALATSISAWLNVVLLSLYVRFTPSCEKTRAPFSLKAFHDLKVFMKLAVSSALMVCLEWWAYEALVIFSGWLPNPQLETSVFSICYNNSSFAFMVPSGLGSMASTRVSNELGAGRPDAARRALYVSAGIASCEAVVVSTTFISLRNVLGRLYSSEEAVIKYIAKLMPILAASSTIDSIQGLLTGVARGCGWQKICAYINLASYYGVGLPVAFLLAFVFNIKSEGLWVGINAGSVVQLIALVAITWATKWEKEAEKAAGRVRLPPNDAAEPLLLR
eukprot:c25236_g2_i1 orf=50-1498(+)